MEWYVLIGQDRKGPLSEAELGEMAETADVTPDTMVWNESMDEWIAAKDCEPLVAAFPVLRPKKMPPPPPEPAKRQPPPPPPHQSATPPPPPGGGFANVSSTPPQGDPGTPPSTPMHWLGKFGQKTGGGPIWAGGSTPEQLNPTTAVGQFRLEIHGACLLIACIYMVSLVINSITTAGSGGAGGIIVIFLISAGLAALMIWAGKTAMAGSYMFAKVMFIINIVLSGLGVLGGVMAMANAPLSGLLALIFGGGIIVAAVLGLTRISALNSVQG